MEFFHTTVTERAIALVVETLRSGRLSEGPRVLQFEQALSRELGLLRPVALNSGTSALHLALALAGVGPGDEVVLPAQTFVATGTAIVMQGAIPVFADIDPMTGNLDPKAFERAISPRTRAVIPVHWAGYPCDMAEIASVANGRGMAVIEDAAHGLGATYRDRPIGTLSRFTAFSFQAIKHLTTGDGGALCCGSEEDEKAARRRRWFGIDREHSVPSLLGERVYDLNELGYKYHLNDLAAALGLGNLEGFRERLATRRDLAGLYRERLHGVPGLRLLRQETDRASAWWLFTVLVERRDDLIRRLAEHGVPASVVHVGIDRNTLFGGKRTSLAGQRRFDAEQLALPLHEGLSRADVAAVCDHIRRGW
jgi:perosamine synthetase